MFRDSHVLCIYVMNILCTLPIFMYGYVTYIYIYIYIYIVEFEWRKISSQTCSFAFANWLFFHRISFQTFQHWQKQNLGIFFLGQHLLHYLKGLSLLLCTSGFPQWEWRGDQTFSVRATHESPLAHAAYHNKMTSCQFQLGGKVKK